MGRSEQLCDDAQPFPSPVPEPRETLSSPSRAEAAVVPIRTSEQSERHDGTRPRGMVGHGLLGAQSILYNIYPPTPGNASENSAGFRLRGSLGVGVNEPVDPWAGGEQYRCAGAASIQATRMLSTFCLSSSFYCHQKATLGSERAAR